MELAEEPLADFPDPSLFRLYQSLQDAVLASGLGRAFRIVGWMRASAIKALGLVFAGHPFVGGPSAADASGSAVTAVSQVVIPVEVILVGSSSLLD